MSAGDPRKTAVATDLAGALVWTIAAAKAFWQADPGSPEEAEAYEALRDRLELLLRESA